MKFLRPVLLGLVAMSATAALAEPNRVTLPDIETLEHFTTVTRGNVTEHMMTTREAIDAVDAGQAIPPGNHVVLVDYREGEIYRYFVMLKGDGWGDDYPEAERADDWQFQWFWGDGSINLDENTARCRSCHRGRADDQFMFTYNDLAAFE